MRKLRWHLWVAMLAVALSAVALWAVQMVRLRQVYLARAAEHASHEIAYRRPTRFAPSFPAEQREELLHIRGRLASYHAEMGRKWLVAASRPWASVALDPAPPAEWSE